MKPFISIFERTEAKYLMTAVQCNEFVSEMKKYTVPDSYGNSTISNIYYDTPTDTMIRHSLDHPLYKEKLRLRCYETPASLKEPAQRTTAFVEIKKKFDDVVYKRRVPMPYPDAVAFLNRGILPSALNPEDEQIVSEMKWMMHMYPGLRPAMFISYERRAFFGADDDSLRITLDKNILWRTSSLALSAGVFGEPLLADGDVLAEIKLPGAMPLWMAHKLDELHIYPSSFSKYGKAYEASVFENISSKGVTFCA